MVIGASVGTTVTGVLASLGASVPAKRTALSLVLFTIGTGAATFVFLPIILQGFATLGFFAGGALQPSRLAAFHSAFVAVGIAVVLPFTRKFARQVERLLPHTGPDLTANLDDSILGLPVVAMETVRPVLRDTARSMIELLLKSLNGIPAEADIERVEQALGTARDFFTRIPAQAGHAEGAITRTSLLHALDHLVRLEAYLRPPEPVQRALQSSSLRQPTEMAVRTLEFTRDGIQGKLANGWVKELQKMAKQQGEWNRKERPRILQRTASGESGPAEALPALDAMRWLARAVDHVARVSHDLAEQADAETLAEHERRLA